MCNERHFSRKDHPIDRKQAYDESIRAVLKKSAEFRKQADWGGGEET